MSVNLTALRLLKGLKLVQFYGSGVGVPNNQLNLNHHELSIGDIGLVNASLEETRIVDGVLSAHRGGTLKITNTVDTDNELFISAEIADYLPSNKTSLQIIRDTHGYGSRIVALGGAVSNTFTGDLTIEGINILRLKKQNGAIAVSGNMHVRNGARVEFYGKNQITRNAEVALISWDSDISAIVFQSKEKLSENFYKLTVEGTGRIDFGDAPDFDTRFIYLDDLQITDGSRLLIDNWHEGRDFLLVRKDSTHLNGALARIEFEQGQKWGHLEDYNHDYWAITHAMPEPATYGAAIAVTGLGVLAWRRRKKHKATQREA